MRSLRALLVEDSPPDAELVVALLEDSGAKADVEICSSLRQALNVLGGQSHSRRARVGRPARAALRLLRVLMTVARRRAPLLQCLGLLAVVIVVTAIIAVYSWRATADERLRLAAKFSSAPESSLETSLVADDTAALTDTSGSAARPDASPPRADRRSARSTPIPASGGGGFTMSGPVLGFIAVNIVLLLGSGASFLVLRRYRRLAVPSGGSAGLQDDHVDAGSCGDLGASEEIEDTEPTVPADDLAGQDEASLRPPAVSDSDLVSDHDGVLRSAGASDLERTPEPSNASSPVRVPMPSGSPDGAAGGRLDLYSTEASPPSRFLVEAQGGWAAYGTTFGENSPEVGGGGARPGGFPGAERLDGAAIGMTSQRIYERRAARRVIYERDAELVSRRARLQVRTVNLSETGLKCSLQRSESPGPASWLPAEGEYLSVVLPLSGTNLEIHARVIWRRQTAQGAEFGLEFRGMQDTDLLAVRAECAMQPSSQP